MLSCKQSHLTREQKQENIGRKTQSECWILVKSCRKLGKTVPNNNSARPWATDYQILQQNSPKIRQSRNELHELDNQKTPNSSDSVESVTLFFVNMPRLFLSPCFSPACVSALSRSRAPPHSLSPSLSARGRKYCHVSPPMQIHSSNAQSYIRRYPTSTS